MMRLSKMPIAKVIRVNNKNVIYNDVNILNINLSKCKNIKKILENQKFKANFLSSDTSSAFFNLSINMKFTIMSFRSLLRPLNPSGII